MSPLQDVLLTKEPVPAEVLEVATAVLVQLAHLSARTTRLLAELEGELATDPQKATSNDETNRSKEQHQQQAIEPQQQQQTTLAT